MVLIEPCSCKLAKKMSVQNLPIKRFGASDCTCQSHLFEIGNFESINKSTQEMQMQLYQPRKNLLD